MKKVITIESCEDCKFVWLYLGLDECCGLLNRKPIPLDDDNPIPAWCPLQNAPQEIVDAETRLMTSAAVPLSRQAVR